MNRWLDISLVTAAVLASLAYAIYSLGPRRIKDTYSRLATKYFGLRSAKLFSGSNGCGNCGPPVKKPLPHNLHRHQPDREK
jgi:hypothetical protein